LGQRFYQQTDKHKIRAIALMMEAESTSETWVKFYQTTRRNNSEDGHLKNVFVCSRIGT
jgi:hypothetical protein